MSRQLLPIVVVFLSSAVPRLRVTHSRMMVLSPTVTVHCSPRYFKSCGGAEITAPGKMRQFLPMRAPSMIVLLEPIQVPSPTSTSLCMVTKGSITTLSAILAWGCIYAKGWIMLLRFFAFLQFVQLVQLLLQCVRQPYRYLSSGQSHGGSAPAGCNERSKCRRAQPAL